MLQAKLLPRLVFFQWDHQPLAKIAPFMLQHTRAHVQCLSLFFDVFVVSHDCDYSYVCDKYEPDLTLFESGYQISLSRKISVSNTSANLHVPKLGLHNADCWSPGRAAFLSDMEEWGIENFFSISVPTAEYTPAISESVYVWPNFIDPEIFRDYSQPKIIPVMLTGSTTEQYPWRREVYSRLAQSYPAFACPHAGYTNASSQRMLHGENYARALNSSWFAPACGTVSGEIVRKHFEIPGSRACLVAERTPALDAAGFVDMENCVFGTGKDIVDRLDYLFSRVDLLNGIIDRGHQLVHSLHTMAHRDQIYQWWLCKKELRPGQKIIQDGPFGRMRIVDALSRDITSHISSNPVDRALIKQGDSCLWDGRIEEAEDRYRDCLKYFSNLPEAIFRLGLCALFRGDAQEALRRMTSIIGTTVDEYRGRAPDPVEWAYLLVALLCQGRLEEASRCAGRYPSLSHVELGRAKRAVAILTGAVEVADDLAEPRVAGRKSIHQLPAWSDSDWLARISTMLAACGQHGLAHELCLSHSRWMTSSDMVGRIPRQDRTRSRPFRYWLKMTKEEKLEALLCILGAAHPRVPPLAEFRYIRKFVGQTARGTLGGYPAAGFDLIRRWFRSRQEAKQRIG